jgi:hypothetical protein
MGFHKPSLITCWISTRLDAHLDYFINNFPASQKFGCPFRSPFKITHSWINSFPSTWVVLFLVIQITGHPPGWFYYFPFFRIAGCPLIFPRKC